MQPAVLGELYWILFDVEEQLLRICFLPVQNGGVTHILPLTRLRQVKSLDSGHVWTVAGEINLDLVPEEAGKDRDGRIPSHCLEFPARGDKTYQAGYPRLEFILK